MVRSDAEENVQRLLRAARDAVGEEGAGVGVRSIADRAGVGVTTLYRHFRDKWALIDGVNDQVTHARQLAQTLRGLPVKVNLIPMNPIEASELHAPKPEAVEAFRLELGLLRVSCSVRQTRGDDVDAAAMQRAAEWVCERVEAAGGTAETNTDHGGNPLALGEIPASRDGAPTILIYGH